MKITVEIKDEDAQLILDVLEIDIRKGIEKLAANITEGLVKMAILKKSGVKIDLKKIATKTRELGMKSAKGARKGKTVKG